MIVKKSCPYCNGSGVVIVQTSSFLGLMKKETASGCSNCGGTGQVVETAPCRFCDGQGLVGNEREICRSCNGTGRADAFGFIPLSRLHVGTHFERRCDKCGSRSFEIVSEIETVKLTKTWEREEELRQVELVERIKVKCASCTQTYHIPIDRTWHQELSSEELRTLEDIGVNLSFMYTKP